MRRGDPTPKPASLVSSGVVTYVYSLNEVEEVARSQSWFGARN
jgi:hypothetical protein